MTFAGKVALVTGSTRGIGWATAQQLAAGGATIIVNGRSDGDLVIRVEELKREFSVEAGGMAFDAADAAAAKKAYKSIFETYKRLDILVNNAGILRNGAIGMMTDDMIRDTFAVNTIGA